MQKQKGRPRWRPPREKGIKSILKTHKASVAET